MGPVMLLRWFVASIVVAGMFFILFNIYMENLNALAVPSGLFSTLKKGNGTIGSHIEEIFQIVNTTPILWGYRNIRQPTIHNRTEYQREWIVRISKTDFIKRAQPKKLIVYLEKGEWDGYHFTNNKVNCPYARDFEEKCLANFVPLDHRTMFRNHPQPYLYKHNGIDAVIGVRNGFWGEDFRFAEQLLPPGVSQIFYQIESPCHTGSARLGSTGAWLTSQWRGSDIQVNFYQVMKRDVNQYNLMDGINTPFPKLEKVDTSKLKLAAALISNCNIARNDRLGYIKELQKYISLDFYGKCGNLVCPENCKKFIQQNYKFFMAFENCNCQDYITEKFFETALLGGVVPVVMGAPKEDYELSAPPNSFIHVDDFASPKDLAEFLRMLDTDNDRYEEYFHWRRKGWILSHRNPHDFFCRVCGMLFYADFVPPTPWPNISTKFADVCPCRHKSAH